MAWLVPRGRCGFVLPDLSLLKPSTSLCLGLLYRGGADLPRHRLCGPDVTRAPYMEQFDEMYTYLNKIVDLRVPAQGSKSVNDSWSGSMGLSDGDFNGRGRRKSLLEASRRLVDWT